MNYNYHTHTYRCGHATGTPEEYVLNAISIGIKRLGFSEHIPYEFADECSTRYRLKVSETEEYFSDIKALRDKYKAVIDIKIGFETEYYPDKFNGMLEFARKSGAEYLILGQHFMNGIFTGGSHVISGTDSTENLRAYVSDLICAMETGVISYIAHPDMFNFLGDNEIYEKEMRMLCLVSKELNVPVEVNCQGISDNRIYPADRFWSIAGDIGCPVTIGLDAHSAAAACDTQSIYKAKGIIAKHGLNYIGEPKLRKII